MAPAAQKAQQIKKYFLEKDFAFVDSGNFGNASLNSKTYEIHIEKVLALIDKDAIAAKKFKVVLDSVNGAGGPITKKLLAELGCESIAINDEPTGIFEHTPEPLAENLAALCEVTANKTAAAVSAALGSL